MRWLGLGVGFVGVLVSLGCAAKESGPSAAEQLQPNDIECGSLTCGPGEACLHPQPYCEPCGQWTTPPPRCVTIPDECTGEGVDGLSFPTCVVRATCGYYNGSTYGDEFAILCENGHHDCEGVFAECEPGYTTGDEPVASTGGGEGRGTGASTGFEASTGDVTETEGEAGTTG